MRWLLLVALLLPPVHAFSCSDFSGAQQQACEELVLVDENLIANLIVVPSDKPSHEVVEHYNEEIVVESPPFGVLQFGSGVVKDAWVRILSLQPSVRFENELLIEPSGIVRVAKGHRVELPATEEYGRQRDGRVCRVEYELVDEQATISVLTDNAWIGDSEYSTFSAVSDGSFVAHYDVSATVRKNRYEWDGYCCRRFFHWCRRWCYECEYDGYSTYTDSLRVSDTMSASVFNEDVSTEFTVINRTRGFGGVLVHSNYSNVQVYVNDSYLFENLLWFSANFTNKPHYLLEVKATRINDSGFSNLLKSESTYYLPRSAPCAVNTTGFFETNTSNCDYEQGRAEQSFKQHESTSNWIFLFRLSVLAFILWGVYSILRKVGKKALPMMLLPIMFLPSVAAAEECGLTNLASCIPQKFIEYIVEILNAPLTPLLDGVRALLENSPSIQLFGSVWAVVVYALSLLYGLLFVYAGLQFLFSGHDVLKRENAKQWLKNTVLTIVFVQASFYLYGLFVDLGSSLTSAVLGMVDPSFFVLTADNLANLGLELLLVLGYALVLLITLLLLTLRYLLVSLGVLFAPVAVFCYFIPPLRSYGKLLLHLLGSSIFVTFIASIIILACGQLIELPIFEDLKILVMITCFLLIDSLFLLLGFHIIAKSSLGDGASNIAQAAKFIGKVF